MPHCRDWSGPPPAASPAQSPRSLSWTAPLHYPPSTISPRSDPKTGLYTRDENFDCFLLRIFVVANTLYRYELALSVEKNNQIEISLFMLPPHIINSLVNSR